MQRVEKNAIRGSQDANPRISGTGFAGGVRGAAHHLEIPVTDICGVSRSRDEISRLPTIRLDVRGLGVLIFGAIGGIALRAEILDQLQGVLQ